MNEIKFIEELKKLNISSEQNKLLKLKKYYEILIEKNKVMNLTAKTEIDEVYLKHFYDSLTISKIIDLNLYETFCDIGTGAGFPGIVIKIFYPHLKVTLIESMTKRVEFLKYVIKELELKDIEVINARAEEYAKTNRELFDIVTARAVANINILLEYSIPLVKIGKYFVAMKGKKEEVSTSCLNLLNTSRAKIESFNLLNGDERTLYLFLKQNKTPIKYPRKYNEIKKKNL